MDWILISAYRRSVLLLEVQERYGLRKSCRFESCKKGKFYQVNIDSIENKLTTFYIQKVIIQYVIFQKNKTLLLYSSSVVKPFIFLILNLLHCLSLL